MDIFLAITGLFFMAILLFILLCRRGSLAGGRFFLASGGRCRYPPESRAFCPWQHRVLLLPLPVGGKYYGVRPIFFFGFYCVCVFCFHGPYLWYIQAGKRRKKEW